MAKYVAAPVATMINVCRMEATDNAALKEECQLSFAYSDKMDSKVQSINLKWDNDAKCYKGVLDITENMHPGEWHIDKVCVEDTAGNQADIDYKKFAENKVTIENDNFDMEEPKIISFSMDKAGQTLKAGEQVTFTAEVTDNKGVGSVYISMKYTSDDRFRALRILSGILRPDIMVYRLQLEQQIIFMKQKVRLIHPCLPLVITRTTTVQLLMMTRTTITATVIRVRK